MAFEATFFDGTNAMKTTVETYGMGIYYSKKFLKRVTEEVRLANLGVMERLPKGQGKTMEWFGWNNVPVSVSGAHLSEGVNPDATTLSGRQIQRTIQEWGAFSQHSSLITMTHIDGSLARASEIWGDHAANVVDLITHMEVCSKGAYPLRADLDSSKTFSGTVDSATSTTVVDAGGASTDINGNTDYGDANDDLNQSIIVITSGDGYGQARAVTNYVQASGTITVSPAWDVTPAANDTYVVTSADGLTSSDKLSTTNVRKAVETLRNNKATPMRGGYYVGLLSPTTEAGLMSDTNWTNVMQYKDAPAMKTQGLFTGEVGMWGGVRWIRTTQPFRFPITTIGTDSSSYGVGAFDPANSAYTNYSSSGAVYSNLILGQEAFGVSGFKDKAGIVRPGIIIKNPGSGDTSNPLNRYSTVGWVLPFTVAAFNPMFAVQIWSGA